MIFLPTTSMTTTKAATLPSVSTIAAISARDRRAVARVPLSTPASAGSSTSTSTMPRSWTTSQPTAIRPRSVSSSRRSWSSAEQYHGAGDGQRDTEHEAGCRRPALPPADRHAERRRHERLRERAGDGDGADRQQVLEREMQANPEHQQDDADFGELIGNALVGDEARRERADGDAGEQIADQRRQPQALGHEAEGEGEHKPYGERRDERCRMRHAKDPLGQRAGPQLGPRMAPATRVLPLFRKTARRSLQRTAPVLGSVCRDNRVPRSMARCLSGDRPCFQPSSRTRSLFASKRTWLPATSCFSASAQSELARIEFEPQRLRDARQGGRGRAPDPRNRPRCAAPISTPGGSARGSARSGRCA